ncbi:MAG: tyrosine-type recombinase/integrase, partial [Nitrososphaera sp.]
MSRANLIYDFEGRIRRELRNVETCDRVNGQTIIKYHLQRVADGISLARQHKCLCTLKQISIMLGKQFRRATKDDIVRLVATIEQRPDFSAWTKRDYKIILKLFYRWLYGYEKGDLPPLVKWIRTGYKIPNELKKSDLLTMKEITKLVRAAENPRDKALILMLAESGRRLGEILTLRIEDVEFDKIGARLTVDGKMGQDYSRVIGCSRQLAAWLRIHPDRHNPKALLWVKHLDNRKQIKQMRYD